MIAGVFARDGAWIGTPARPARQSRPPTAADHTRIGSLTRTMTATVLLQLVRENRLPMDDPIGRFVQNIRTIGPRRSGSPT